jgi:hypothetical protein
LHRGGNLPKIRGMEVPPRPSRRRSSIVLAAILGSLFGLAVALLFWAYSHRDRLPQLSQQDFEDAQSRWRKNGPRDYDVEVEVSGRQPAIYRVEVRGGEPAAAFRNGQPLTQKRTWFTWSVPGMFGTLESDFNHVARVTTGDVDENTPRLRLFGIFHPKYGYPERYRRIMLGQGREESMAHRIGQSAAPTADTSAMETVWTVREFTVREGD